MSCINRTASAPSGRMGQDRYDPILRLAQIQPPRNPNKPLTSFLIADILSCRGSEPRRNYPRHPSGAAKNRVVQPPTVIRRPWDDNNSSRSGGFSTDMEEDEEVDDDDEEEEEISVDDEKGHLTGLTTASVCPLDALLKMTSKTFDANERNSQEDDVGGRDSGFGQSMKSQPSKKRRKSRTAFTNKQIYELEKRFLYQKYLTPVDRDEIAQSLGLTNAQVITWFQNRRAKLKRDMEELKADVSAAQNLGHDSTVSVIGGIEEVLKTSKHPQARKKDAKSGAGLRPESTSIGSDSAGTPGVAGPVVESDSTGSSINTDSLDASQLDSTASNALVCTANDVVFTSSSSSSQAADSTITVEKSTFPNSKDELKLIEKSKYDDSQS